MIRRPLAVASRAAFVAVFVFVPRIAAAQSMPEPQANEPAKSEPAAAPAEPAAAPAAPAKKAERVETFESMGPHAITWDANLEGGFGRAFGDIHPRTVSFARVRAGILWAHGQWFTSAGIFYDLSNFTPGTFGIQVEQMHLSSGFWIQAGAGIDVEPRAMGMLAVGWSVVGVEAQYRSFGDAGIGPAFFGKLRIPLGLIGFALSNRH